MNCCVNCFSDEEIIGHIFSNSTQSGTCDFCGSLNVKLINCRELGELFQPLIDLFVPAVEQDTDADQKYLHEKIQHLWNIFNISDPGLIKRLLESIVSDTLTPESPKLNMFVEMEVQSDDFHAQKWENFADEIKYKNRFFLNETVDLTLLSSLLEYFTKTYSRGKLFYRSRICEQEAFGIENMGKLPANRSTSGRANPTGIPYLYISTTPETSVYECRASFPDLLTIAEFKLLEPLKVINLSSTMTISPFFLGENLKHYIVHQKYLVRLEKELSKPVRKFDKEADYLPSQYLCEYVKSRGYDAIEYGSSLNTKGVNLAVFNDKKLVCKSAELYEIAAANLEFVKVDA